MMKQVGIHPVVVHGGGPQIGRDAGAAVDREPLRGRHARDRCADTMQVVEMVLGGLVNKDIVSRLDQAGGRAVGLTGQGLEPAAARS